MFWRMMSSETSKASDTTARNSVAPNSLNGFVVSHQSLANGTKPHRAPGLPRGASRASTGNLVSVGTLEGSAKRCTGEFSNAVPILRSSSVTNGLPPPDWLNSWSNDQVMAPQKTTVPLTEVLKQPVKQSHNRTANGHSGHQDNRLERPVSPFLGNGSSKSAPNSRPGTPVPTLNPYKDHRDNAPKPAQPANGFPSPRMHEVENLEDLAELQAHSKTVSNIGSPPSTVSNSDQSPRPAQGLSSGSSAQPQGPDAKLSQQPQQVPSSDQGGVPVFVMMPLDTVTADGYFRHSASRWFHHALDALAQSGVYGIAVDVWWGAVERQPQEYDWTGYRQLFAMAKSKNLKVQAVLSFHACGGNVGDSAQIPLPQWVLEAGDDTALFFKDKPRPSRDGLVNKEYISFWADEAPRVLYGRSPLECYTDYMREFRNAFADEIGDLIEEIIIGSGPCGELRYASYPETNGWRFPGVGEFQCYDKRALASLAEHAQRTGHPEWGQTGPHDAGEYNSMPDETGFFRGWEGSWDSPYGRFFLNWYSRSLLEHGERLLQAARSVFNFKSSSGRPAILAQTLPPERQSEGQERPLGTPPRPSKSLESNLEGNVRQRMLENSPGASPSLVRQQSTEVNGDRGLTPTSSTSSFLTRSEADSNVDLNNMAANGASNLADRPKLKRTGQRYDGKSLSLAQLENMERLPYPTHATRSEDGERQLNRRSDEGPRGKPVGITLKVAGVHWWYRTNAHAAELTAGYFNVGGRDGYRDIVKLCAKYGATFTLTCVEMCDSQHPPETLCGPEGLLRQVKEVAAEFGVEIGGENALPCFFPMHIDDAGLDRIVYNAQPWVSPLQRELAREEAFSQRGEPTVPSPLPPLPDAKSLGFQGDPRSVKSGKLLASHLPRMRGLTFLRLTQEMMTPPYQGAWLRFMQRMQNIGNKPQLC